jgi:TRAP-type mannitol/chloroaromatic compound transport system permease small subunit
MLRGLLQRLDIVTARIARVVSWLNVVILIFVVREVIGRYFFNYPSGWTDEINRYLLCFMSTLAGAYCVATDSHIRVDILWRRWGNRTQAVVELLTYGVALLFVGVVIWIGVAELFDAIVQGKRSMSIYRIPLWPTIGAVTVGSCLVFVQLLARLLRNVLGLVGGGLEYHDSLGPKG